MPTSPSNQPPLRLAILLSGSGRTLQNLADQINRSQLNAKIVTVISSNPDAYGLVRAKNLDLPTHVVSRKDSDTASGFSDLVYQHIRNADAQLVCLAGFLCLLPIPDDFTHRVINIHPALLPSFGGKGMYGHRVHQAVIDAGCKVTGCTVHYCDQTYDTGPIIVQRTCPVLENDTPGTPGPGTPDTLAQRVFEEECIAYPHAIRLIAAGRVTIEPRHTTIIPEITGDLVTRARLWCLAAHQGQLRDNDKPYATHPCAVAQLLIDHGVDDPATLAAAYLHDVLEDTPQTPFQLTQAFGQTVTQLVEQLTIPDTPNQTFEQKHATIAQMAKQMSDQAKLVKLADRTHNLSEMTDAWPAERQIRYARATVDLLNALKPWPNQDLASRIQHAVKPLLDGSE